MDLQFLSLETIMQMSFTEINAHLEELLLKMKQIKQQDDLTKQVIKHNLRLIAKTIEAVLIK